MDRCLRSLGKASRSGFGGRGVVERVRAELGNTGDVVHFVPWWGLMSVFWASRGVIGLEGGEMVFESLCSWPREEGKVNKPEKGDEAEYEERPPESA